MAIPWATPAVVPLMRQTADVRAIVIGAGFAGLACADRLVTLGHDVTVLGARDRG